MNDLDIIINYRGVDFEVRADIQPEEPQTRDYPGCSAQIEHLNISHKGIDFDEFFFEYDDFQKHLDKIEELIWEYLSNQ